MRDKRNMHGRAIKVSMFLSLASLLPCVCSEQSGLKLMLLYEVSYCCLSSYVCIQMAQQQKAEEREDHERTTVPPLADSRAPQAELRAAAGEAARLGDPGVSQQRFRDPACFIPDQKESRYEDKDFAVNKDKDALVSAVLDLQQDDAVRVHGTT